MSMLIIALALALASHAGAYEVYQDPNCLKPVLPTGKTYYFDPVNGSISNDGLTPKTAFPGLDKAWAAGLFDTMVAQRTTTTDASGKVTTNYGWPCGQTNYTCPDLVWLHAHPKTAKIGMNSTILLMSGDHGSVSMGTAVMDTTAKTWMLVKPAPNAEPILHGINFNGWNWIFDGLTYYPDPNQYAVFAGSNAFSGPAHDLIVNGSTVVGSKLDPHTAQPSDWFTPAVAAVPATTTTPAIPAVAGHTNIGSGLGSRNMSCVAFTNNKISKVWTGLSSYTGVLTDTAGDQRFILYKGNEVNYFAGNDGLDYSGNHLMIDSNYIHNVVETHSGMHYDGMQCQPGSGEPQQMTDIMIQNNRVVRQDDPALMNTSYMQGIDCFDGSLNKVTVKNNLVVTSHWHCISFFGTSNFVADHNTCIADGSTIGGANQPWIGAFTGKAGVVPAVASNASFTNNVSYQFSNASVGTLVSNHNVGYQSLLAFDHFYDPAYAADKKTQLVDSVTGLKAVVYNFRLGTESKDGVYSNANVVKHALLSDYPKLDLKNMVFDVSTIVSDSPAVGLGYIAPGTKQTFVPASAAK